LTDQLRVAWSIERERLLEGFPDPVRPGLRPWAYWRFDLGEDEPPEHDKRVVRLAELGLLSAGEVAAIRERADEAGLRIGTDREHYSPNSHPDRKAVALWEAVQAALAC
jgi:hypothetical protein